MTDNTGEASPLREAIAAVIADYDWIEDDTAEDMVEQLVGVVEGVPVKVTIRDLDMDPENIVTVREDQDLAYLRRLACMAEVEGALHLTVDRGALKIKVGNASWTPAIPTEVYEG